MRLSTSLLLLPASLVYAQTTYDVSVGPGFVYSPANLTISVGDTVRFTFAQGAQHTATHGYWANCTRQDTPFFDFNGSSSSTATKVFTSAGTYEYICTVSGHCDAGMKGVINVL